MAPGRPLFQNRKANDPNERHAVNSEAAVQKLRTACQRALDGQGSVRFGDLRRTSAEVKAALTELNWPDKTVINMLKQDPALLFHQMQDGTVWLAAKQEHQPRGQSVARRASTSEHATYHAGSSPRHSFLSPPSFQTHTSPKKPTMPSHGRLGSEQFGIIDLRTKKKADEESRLARLARNRARLSAAGGPSMNEDKGKQRAQDELDDIDIFHDNDLSQAQTLPPAAPSSSPGKAAMFEEIGRLVANHDALHNIESRERGSLDDIQTDRASAAFSHPLGRSRPETVPPRSDLAPASTSQTQQGNTIEIENSSDDGDMDISSSWVPVEQFERQPEEQRENETLEQVHDRIEEQPHEQSGSQTQELPEKQSEEGPEGRAEVQSQAQSVPSVDQRIGPLPGGLSGGQPVKSPVEESSVSELSLMREVRTEAVVTVSGDGTAAESPTQVLQSQAAVAVGLPELNVPGPNDLDVDMAESGSEEAMRDHVIASSQSPLVEQTAVFEMSASQPLLDEPRQLEPPPHGRHISQEESAASGPASFPSGAASIGKKSRRSTTRIVGGSLTVPVRPVSTRQRTRAEARMDLDDPTQSADESDAEIVATMLVTVSSAQIAEKRRADKQKRFPVLDGYRAARSGITKASETASSGDGEASTRDSSANVDSALEEEEVEDVKPNKPTRPNTTFRRTARHSEGAEDDDDDGDGGGLTVSSVPIGVVPGRTGKSKAEREAERKEASERRQRERDAQKRKRSRKAFPTFRTNLDSEYDELMAAYKERREARVLATLPPEEDKAQQTWQLFESWQPPSGSNAGADMNAVAFWPYNLPYPGRQKDEAIVAICGGTAVRVLRLSEKRGITELWNANDESANWEKENERENLAALKWTYEVRGDAGVSPYWRKWPLLIVAGSGREAKILDGYTGTTVKILQAHGGPITSIAVHPTLPHIVATASHDETINLWDISVPVSCPDVTGKVNNIYEADKRRKGFASGERLAVFGGFEGHEEAILSIAFHPSLPFILSGGVDCKLRIWRLPKHLPQRPTSSLMKPLAISPPKSSTRTPNVSFPVWIHHSLHSHHITYVSWIGSSGAILTTSLCFASPGRRVVRIFRPKFFDSLDSSPPKDVLGASIDFDSEVDMIARWVAPQASENIGNSIVDTSNELSFDPLTGKLHSTRRLYFPTTEPAIHCYPIDLNKRQADADGLLGQYPISLGQEVLTETDKQKENQLRAIACQPAGRGWMVAVGEMEKFNAWVKTDRLDEDAIRHALRDQLRHPVLVNGDHHSSPSKSVGDHSSPSTSGEASTTTPGLEPHIDGVSHTEMGGANTENDLQMDADMTVESEARDPGPPTAVAAKDDTAGDKPDEQEPMDTISLQTTVPPTLSDADEAQAPALPDNVPEGSRGILSEGILPDKEAVVSPAATSGPASVTESTFKSMDTTEDTRPVSPNMELDGQPAERFPDLEGQREPSVEYL